MSVKNWILDQDPRIRFRRALLSIAAVLAVLAFALFYTNVGLTYYFSPMRSNGKDQVVILTTTWCPFCRSLVQALNASKLPYQEIDVEKDWKTSYALYSTRRTGIPVTILGDTVVAGGLSTQLQAIQAACRRRNIDARYDCDKLAGFTRRPLR